VKNYALTEILKTVINYTSNVNALFTRGIVRGKIETDDVINSIESLKDSYPDIYTKLVLLPFLTVGTATSSFNYQDLLPQKLRHELITSALNDYIGNDLTSLTEDFLFKYLKKEYTNLKYRVGTPDLIGFYKIKLPQEVEEDLDEEVLAGMKKTKLGGNPAYTHIYEQVEKYVLENKPNRIISRVVANYAPSTSIVTTELSTNTVGQKLPSNDVVQESTNPNALSNMLKERNQDVYKALMSKGTYDANRGSVELVKGNINNTVIIKNKKRGSSL